MRLLALLAASTCLAAGAANADDARPVLDANHAAAGGGAWTGKGALQIDWAYAGQGLTGKAGTAYDVSTGAFVDSFDIGPTTGANGFDGAQAWMQDPSGAVTPQAGGDTRQLAVNEAYRDANLWWRSDNGGAQIASLGVRREDGRTFDVLKVTPRGGKAFEAWFDAGTHLLARTVEGQGSQTVTTFYSDYRAVDGAMLAGKLVIDTGQGEQYRQSQTLTSARFAPARPLSAYAAPKVALNDARILNGTGRATVPFQLYNNHIYADVKVNGKGPFRFIFDTGGHDLLTPDTAKALALKAEGEAPGSGTGDNVVDFGFLRDVTFQIGDLEIRDKAPGVLPFEAPQVEGVAEKGMIGFEVFRRFVTEIDYGKGTLTFIEPSRFDPRGAGTPVPFVFYSHLPQVEGTFEGLSGKFDIDTGSRVELSLTKPFVDANGLIAKHPKGVTAVDGWGVGGRTRSYVSRGGPLVLGPVKIDHVVSSFATSSKGSFSDPNYQGNVGSGLLKRFVVTFDYDHQIMYLKPRPAPVPDAGTFDRAGFWINTAPKGYEIVDLTAGGPAARAGLKTGDVITAVDGAPAGEILLPDLRKRLRADKAGTVVKLTVETAGQARDVPLKLADQI